VREAIKVGLAMTVAYYLPLRFEWMSATWPAVAVAFISLPTAGQSIQKGLLRIAGTLMAFVASLLILGLFTQQRWLFLLAFSLYLAVVTYKMTGRDGQYFWFCAAFVAMMIATAGPGDGDAFEYAAYRTMETIAGVAIWTVISVLLWPRWTPQAPAGPADPRDPIRGPFGLPVLDPDRVRATVMVVVSMWAASLIWIYLNPPGHSAWYNFVPTLALVAAQVPHVRFRLLRPLLYAYLAALCLYVFLMPQMSSFLQLGALLFGLTFVAAYYFTGLARVAIYLSMFTMLGITNQQSYDFAVRANILLFTLLGILVVFALTYITRSPRPEKAFLSMMRRFRRSHAYIVSQLEDPVASPSWLDRMRLAFQRQELRSLPAKLEVWARQIDFTRLPQDSPARVDETLSALKALSSRTEELIETRLAGAARQAEGVLEDRLREISRAAIAYAEASSRVHWTAWREERF
jgi:uncharacterized membrane protein YccC